MPAPAADAFKEGSSNAVSYVREQTDNPFPVVGSRSESSTIQLPSHNYGMKGVWILHKGDENATTADVDETHQVAATSLVQDPPLSL